MTDYLISFNIPIHKYSPECSYFDERNFKWKLISVTRYIDHRVYVIQVSIPEDEMLLFRLKFNLRTIQPVGPSLILSYNKINSISTI